MDRLIELWNQAPTWSVWLGGFLLLTSVWFLWISRGTNDSDPNTLEYRLHRAWRRIAFWAGDVHIIHYNFFGVINMPWPAWGKHTPRVSPETLLEKLKLVEAGDVFLGTHEDASISNLGIPGVWKHAGVVCHGPDCVNSNHRRICDVSVIRIVEAVSEGVVERHPEHTRCDRMIYLRPKGVSEADVDRFKTIIHKLVGAKYDASFKFNMEEELKWLKDTTPDVDKAVKDEAELKRAVQNHRGEYDMAFSCTETVATAWWHKRHDLRLYRKKSRGRMVIVADQFVNHGWDIIWTNIKPDEGKKMGLHEEGVSMLEDYWKDGNSEGGGNI